MNKLILISSLLACATLAGCQQPAAPSSDQASTAPAKPAVEQPAATAPKSAWDESMAPVAGTSLTVAPAEVDFCNQKTARVEVSWDFATSGAKTAQIWIRSSKEDKLWAAFNEKTGKRMTGNWAKPTTEFLLVDPGAKKLLQKTRVSAKSCD